MHRQRHGRNGATMPTKNKHNNQTVIADSVDPKMGRACRVERNCLADSCSPRKNEGGFFLGKGLGFVGGNEVIMEVEKEDGGGIVEAEWAMSVDATTG